MGRRPFGQLQVAMLLLPLNAGLAWPAPYGQLKLLKYVPYAFVAFQKVLAPARGENKRSNGGAEEFLALKSNTPSKGGKTRCYVALVAKENQPSD